MPEVLVLGTAASVPDDEHDTIGLALRTPQGTILIDCGGSPLHKLARHGVDLTELKALILSHRHADHLYGLPILIQGLWLGGREAALPIYGSAQALHRARRLLEIFELAERDSLFALEWHPVPLREGRRGRPESGGGPAGANPLSGSGRGPGAVAAPRRRVFG